MQITGTHLCGISRHHCSASTASRLSLRIDPNNPNHHLWKNHGTWYVHYTVAEPGCSGTRHRESLGTNDLTKARRKRDEVFASLGW